MMALEVIPVPAAAAVLKMQAGMVARREVPSLDIRPTRPGVRWQPTHHCTKVTRARKAKPSYRA